MPRKKRYRVVGAQAILDHPPGSEFEAALEPDQEDFFIAIGAIKVLDEEKAPPKPKADPAD